MESQLNLAAGWGLLFMTQDGASCGISITTAILCPDGVECLIAVETGTVSSRKESYAP